MKFPPHFGMLFLITIIALNFKFSESAESHSNSTNSTKSDHPLPLISLKIKSNQSDSTCGFTVSISTSCSSVSYTRDRISLAFGDAYGNQVHVPRLDDPSSRTFERCSTDTFQINGPCTYDVCYVYLYRIGYDGWMPGTVQIYGSSTRTATFYYNTFIPSNVWYGFNYCNDVSASPVE
ncbi:Embryo-specific protein ATS3B-like protein [Drosera capensis]